MNSFSVAERIEGAPELMAEASARLERRDFSDVIALLEPAYDSGVDSLDIVQTLMQAYEGAGDAAKHEEMMAAALQKSSQPPLKLWIAYAEAAMTRKDWPAAVERWQAIVDRYTVFPFQLYIRQARALLAARQFSAALHVANLALEKQPGNSVIGDLKNVIASQKAKKYQLAGQSIASPVSMRWDADEGQKWVATLEFFRHFRIHGRIETASDQQPVLIAKSSEEVSTLALTVREPSLSTEDLPTGTVVWEFEHALDLARDLVLGVRFEDDGEVHDCVRFSLTPVMEVVEGKEGWLFLANDTNASIDQFIGKKRLGAEEKQQWQRFSAEIRPLQRQRSLLLLIANSKEKVRPEYYPYEKASITPTEQVEELLQAGRIDYCNPVAAMQAELDSYYPTDTHWSGRGAYLAFLACMRHFGFDDDFASLYAFEQREVVGDLGSKMDPPAKSLSTVAVFREKSGVSCRFSNYLPGTGNITIFENSRPIHARTLVIFGGSSAGAGGFALLFANVFQRVVVVNLPGSYVHEIVDHEAADHVILQTNERYLATPGRIINTLAEANLDHAVRGVPAAERAKLLQRMNRYASCEPYHDFMTRLLAG
ncbi:alginate O-acetyltransferase AlgX-related protein [Salinicola salarius]|uniref:alginate O-acetyltransferase AlgX-related protein n=1 Tax=Salinicola salarius TaxID=430457 RepID=UPI000B3F87C3|nr:hypothetical protein [Salinicola salarius]